MRGGLVNSATIAKGEEDGSWTGILIEFNDIRFLLCDPFCLAFILLIFLKFYHIILVCFQFCKPL